MKTQRRKSREIRMEWWEEDEPECQPGIARLKGINLFPAVKTEHTKVLKYKSFS